MSDYVLSNSNVKDEYGRLRLIEGDVYKLRARSPNEQRYCIMDELGVKAYFHAWYFYPVKIERLDAEL